MGSIKTVKLIHAKTGTKKNVNFDQVEKYANSGYIPLEDSDKIAIENNIKEVANPPLEKMTLPQMKKVASELDIKRFKRMDRESLMGAIIEAQAPKLENTEEVPGEE